MVLAVVFRVFPDTFGGLLLNDLRKIIGVFSTPLLCHYQIHATSVTSVCFLETPSPHPVRSSYKFASFHDSSFSEMDEDLTEYLCMGRGRRGRRRHHGHRDRLWHRRRLRRRVGLLRRLELLLLLLLLHGVRVDGGLRRGERLGSRRRGRVGRRGHRWRSCNMN